jgi:hypothetical protein
MVDSVPDYGNKLTLTTIVQTNEYILLHTKIARYGDRGIVLPALREQYS